MWQVFRLRRRGLQQHALLRKGWPAIAAVQQRRLRDLVAHAKKHSPFHADRLRDVDPDRFDLRQLPTMTKTEMMQNFDRLLTDRNLRRAELEEFVADPNRLGQWYHGKYAVAHTSGSQGMQALIVQDRAMMELLSILQVGNYPQYSQSPWTAVKRLFRRERLAVVTIGRGFYPSAVGLAYGPEVTKLFVKRLWIEKLDPLDDVVAQLNGFRPHVLLAYASVLEILAREVLAGRLRVAGPLQQVINMSEPLSQGARKLATAAFGLPVTNNYATGECMCLSLGCPQGHGMHLQADWAVLEVVDHENQPVKPGEPGEKVLLTNLYNTLQPFIRYEVGDVVTMSPEPCPCGNPLPLILKVEGRTDEVVWIREGNGYRQVHPYVFVDCLDEIPEVGWYQVVQTERNRFELRASPAPGRQIDVAKLQARMRSGLAHFGLVELIDLDVNVVDDIAPDPHTGKLKRITSRVGAPAEIALSESGSGADLSEAEA